VKVRLADGTSSDLVGLSLPVFFVRSVADFLAFLAARRPDPDTGVADPALVGAWVGEHPEALASGSTPSTWSMGP
jgi:catalase